jgi:hypothetical protein
MMHEVISAKFRPLILEDSVYTITNGRVMLASPKFWALENDIIINFSPTTNMEEI